MRAAASAFWQRQRLTLLGVLFVVAAHAVAFGDAGYPFFSASFAALLALSGLAAGLLALPLAFWQTGRAAAFAIGLTYFLDVTYVGSGPIPGALMVLLAGYLIYLIAWRGNEALVPFGATAVVVATLFILPQEAITNGRINTDSFALAESNGRGTGQPYVHIILDEMSPLALMPDGSFYDELEARMHADYRARGFDLFDDTAVPAGSTHISLGHAWAHGEDALHNYTEPGGRFTYALGENREADILERAGYAVTVLQNSYLETCRDEDWNCMTYARSGDGGSVIRRAERTADAVGYALRSVNTVLVIGESVRSAAYYQALGRLAAFLGFEPPAWRLYVARPPFSVELMEKAASALKELNRGDAVIAHLLLPHFPYVLTEACRMKPPAETMAPRWVMRNTGGGFDRAKAEMAYWRQAACTHDALMAMIDAVLESPVGRDAVILVHGDHGSRLYEKLAHPAYETATAEERRHALTTHFAVRGIDERQADLAAAPDLRGRLSVVLDEIGGEADADLLTSATH